MAPKTNEIPADLPRVHRALADWYDTYGRHSLPWRATRDPYAIYISEIMLQQTQVKTVLERYYQPFLARFPSLKALAEAERGQVIKQWEGLGYYTRAVNLHAAAQQSGGILPDTVEGLLALPGIGRNTAHAVASFGFGVPVPVMEANVKRVLCRVFALRSPDDATLWRKAELLLDKENVFNHNQAMMDIGAMICTRRTPRCLECPLMPICLGKMAPERYPEAKVKKPTPIRRRCIAVFETAPGRYVLSPRATRFLGGLYGFMEYDAEAGRAAFLDKEYRLRPEQLLGSVRQVYSHFTLEAEVYLVQAHPDAVLLPGMVSATLADMQHLPLSGADHKVVQMLQQREASPG